MSPPKIVYLVPPSLRYSGHSDQNVPGRTPTEGRNEGVRPLRCRYSTPTSLSGTLPGASSVDSGGRFRLRLCRQHPHRWDLHPGDQHYFRSPVVGLGSFGFSVVGGDSIRVYGPGVSGSVCRLQILSQNPTVQGVGNY